MEEQDRNDRRRDKLKRFFLPLRNASPTDRKDDDNGSPKTTFPSGIKALCSPESATVDIVFVHGLNGDRERTWTAKGATEPWPKTLLPSILPTARVLAFGYDASTVDWKGVVSQSRIAHHAGNLITSFATYRENDGTNERAIIFVCHSLGGLVCEDALVMSGQRPERHLKSIVRSTRGILFLGTPHHGSGLARWAERLSHYIGLIKQTNPNILQVLKRESEVLARIQDSFHTMIKARTMEGLSPIEITCFYEELPLSGIGLVVPQDSAILPGYIPIGIHSDHMGMTKFASNDDPGFVAVCGELQRWTKEGNAAEEDKRSLPLSSNTDTDRLDGRASQRGNSNSQNNNFGTGVQKVVGGSYYEGHTQTFVHHHYENNTAQAPERAPIFNVPFDPDPDFVDRPDITTWLQDKYTGPASRMALVGMGGFGKSQISIRFAYQVHNESPQTSVYWVYASSKPRFEEAYRSIAERQQLPRRNDPDVNVLRLVCDWLQTEEAGSWLMVLDNADDVNLFYPARNNEGKAGTKPADGTTDAKGDQRPLASYLPKSRDGIILVTSRSMDAAEKLTGSHKTIYRVSIMDDAQGLKLLRNKLIGEFNSDAAADLLRALDYIPLAITQAAAYINRRAPSMSVQIYLDSIRESDKKKGSLLNKDAGDLRRDEAVSNSVFNTWQVTFEQIRRERPSAANLLSFMSFFSPQGIPEFALHGYDTDIADETGKDAENDNFEDDLDMLRGYSLVAVTATEKTYEMHPLVQFCTRSWIAAMGKEARWRLLFLQTMSSQFPSGNFETWPDCRVLLPHIESLIREKPPDEGLLYWAELLDNCSYYLRTIGNYRVAEDLCKKAGEKMTKLLGEEHRSTLKNSNLLALIYQRQGRVKEAETLGTRTLAIRKKITGEEDIETLRCTMNLALIYVDQGQLKEAEELLVGALAVQKRTLGEKNPDTLLAISSLAKIYNRQERWKEAEELMLGVLEEYKRTLGEDHMNTLNSEADLSLIYKRHGRWKEAEELGVGVLNKSKRILGKAHPATLTIMNNLAILWRNLGRTEDALSLMKDCVALRQRVLGLDHPHTKESMAWVATLEDTANRPDLAGGECR